MLRFPLIAVVVLIAFAGRSFAVRRDELSPLGQLLMGRRRTRRPDARGRLAAIAAGVDFIASDQYERLTEIVGLR